MTQNPPPLSQIWPHLPPELREALRESVAHGLEALKVPEPLSLSQWAAKHFYLSAESSQKTQKWRAYGYQIGIMDCMSNDDIEEFDFQKSARLGYTKCLLAMMGYTGQHRRRNQAVWQPTDDDSDDFCKTEVEPMLRDVRIMREVFPAAIAKSKSNTLQQKKFLGSVMKLRGGKAAGNYRRLTIAVAILDELDGFDWEIEKAGDPWTLAHKRLEGATFPKLICGTTPRIKGLSHIENRMAAATVRMDYQCACPHCGVEHPLAWGGKAKQHGFKWDIEDPTGSVKHVCPHCLTGYTQAQYLKVADSGAWVSECGNWRLTHDASDPQKPASQWTTGDGTPCLAPRHVGFHGWTAISPQVTWTAIVREFLDAKTANKNGMRGPLKAFINETLGETWEDEVEKAEAHVLQRRAEAYRATVPAGVLKICAGVDVQDNRFEVILWGFGRGEEMWTVGYIIIDANPADERDWYKLWQVLQTPLQHENGPLISIAGAGVDTGGHFTHQAYSFVHAYAQRSSMRLIALKGSSKQGDPIKGKGTYQDINHAGRIVKRGIKLWMVGTDTAKDLFFGRLKVTQPGPGYVHFSKELPVEFYKGLTAEVRVLARTATGDQYRWVNPKKQRNEALDGTVYAIFISHVLDLHRYEERQWRALEPQLEPNLFEQAVAGAAAENVTVIAGEARQSMQTQPPPQTIATQAKPAAPRPKRAAPFGPSPFAPDSWSSRL